jgi:multidrug resistance efflux pump
MIHKLSSIANTRIEYLPKVKPSGKILYITILCMIIAILLALPLIYVDISIKSPGITRPLNERTELKSTVSGIIDSIFFSEGQDITKGDIILRVKDPNTKSKSILNDYELSERYIAIHDLTILTSATSFDDSLIGQLKSPLYKNQLSRFIHQNADHNSMIDKTSKELEINTKLAKEKVISAKELFDFQNAQLRATSAFNAFLQDQRTNWQQDLLKNNMEVSRFQQQNRQIAVEATYYDITAPVSGTVMGINSRYAGGPIQANETFCNISPAADLIAECYVPSKDVGLLRTNQHARFQIEAFDYNYYGVLTGKIVSIDNDFTLVDKTPVFKIRCLFDSTKLTLKNGMSGSLKKGMNLTARFIVAKRSLWQLLYDTLDDWINPSLPSKTITSSL